MGSVMVAQANDVFGYHIGHTRIDHRLADSEGAGNGNKYIPRDVFGIFPRRENLRPRHDDGCYRNEEEHIHIGDSFLHERQFSDGGSGNHQHQQGQSQPTFTSSGHRLIILAIGQHDKHRRLAPRLNERIVSHHYQRITFTQITVLKILCDALSATFYFFHFSSIMTFEIEVLQPLVNTRETRTQNGFHPM